MSAKVMKWGNSLGILIPAFAARSLGLTAGSEVRVLVLEDEIRVRSARSPVPSSLSAGGEMSNAEAVRKLIEKW
jgi:antitoxin component of MazEF toxin-antitoxin module